MGKMQSDKYRHAKKTNDTKRRFLLTFFDNEEGYEEKEVNGFYLIKQLNKKLKLWCVAIFDNHSHQKRKQYLKERRT